MSAWASNNPLRPAVTLRVAELLGESTVVLSRKPATKDELIGDLVERLCASLSISDPQALAAKVLEREHGISTTLDTGVSLPHARVDGLSRIAAAMAVIPGGLSDPASPDLPVRVVFLFFSPNSKEFYSAHLQLLRAVSSLLQPSLIESLEKASSSASVLELLRGAEGAKK
jgi:PTS system nitrogen regulatory IIA component